MMQRLLLFAVLAGVFHFQCLRQLAASDVTELQRLRSLTDEQLREELEQQGLPPAQAKEGARILRQQLGPRPAQGPATQDPVILKLPEMPTVEVLENAPTIESQFVHVYTDASSVERFSLVNGTVQNQVVNLAGQFRLGSKATDFVVYGVTADGLLFKTSLHAPVLSGVAGRSLNMKAFAVERKHLPLTLYLHRETGEETDSTSQVPEAPAPLMTFLEQEAELILKVRGKEKAPGQPSYTPTLAPSFVVAWDTKFGYLFVPASTRQPVLGKTLKW